MADEISSDHTGHLATSEQKLLNHPRDSPFLHNTRGK